VVVHCNGIITPPISVSSAVEGIRTYPEINTIPIVIGILFVLFSIQQFGTKLVGKFFCTNDAIWFSMLGILGLIQVAKYPEVFKALNPLLPIIYYLYIGRVFFWALCFSVLLVQKHCIRTWAIAEENIRISWIFVKLHWS
jgi:KUP system potassium uptake protein